MSRLLAYGAVVVASLGTLGCGNKPATAANSAPKERAEAADAAPGRAASPEAAVDTAPGEATKEAPSGKDGAEWTTAVDPKPLSENVNRGLAWLVGQQHEDGGWAQGEESQHMGRDMDNLKDRPNVGDTCVAVLALMRSGSTPGEGPYAGNVRKGLDFVCKEVAAAEDETLYVTAVRGTRLQMKLGTYIDTFLSSMLLAEAKDRMPDDEGNKRVLAALDKVMDKIERNQRPDGTWDNRGWATDLAQNVATKSLNYAAQKGYVVDEAVREKAEAFAGKKYEGGRFDVGGGSAGVELYASAAAVNSMQMSENTNAGMVEELQLVVSNGATQAERDEAERKLGAISSNLTQLEASKAAIVKRLDDKGFIAGFGSNGGEEFLSYMNIGESLVVEGGENWEKWDREIAANLNRIQNKDGSWTGHHCITGRTFCTSAALLVLMTDRAPVPVAAKIGRR